MSSLPLDLTVEFIVHYVGALAGNVDGVSSNKFYIAQVLHK